MQELTDDIVILNQWIGRIEKSSQFIDSRTANQMSMLLNMDQEFVLGDELPKLWHWLYFIDAGKQEELGYDGHLKLGGFLPPVSLPRRMWASGEFQFYQSLKIGDKIQRHSTIKDVQIKQGQSGTLCFVTVEHRYCKDQTECMHELHNIVYREKTTQSIQKTAQNKSDDDYDWSINIQSDPVMLFRYSALTFNGHRIHYDREFCTQSEGYPGLVFHGPLTATLLIDQAVQRYPDKVFSAFKFKAIQPIFDIDTIVLAGKQLNSSIGLRALKNNQQLAMQAILQY